jgi:hypothetical protein
MPQPQQSSEQGSKKCKKKLLLSQNLYGRTHETGKNIEFIKKHLQGEIAEKRTQPRELLEHSTAKTNQHQLFAEKQVA